MTPELWIALLNFAVKFGIDAATSIADGIKNSKSIDDAISALHAARLKSTADYDAEAAAGLGLPVPPIAPPAGVPTVAAPVLVTAPIPPAT